MGDERYPLSWPVGWKRTPAHNRKPARFAKGTTTYSNWTDAAGQTRVSTSRGSKELSVADATDRLRAELRRLGVGDNFILSSNVQLRNDGLPRSNQSAPADPGVAVYFKLKGKPRCFACDTWTRVA